MTKPSQQFHRGDVVHIAADLGPTMSHFTSDVDAIVMYSYAERYGGSDVGSYSVMFCDDGSECAWYHPHQFTLLRHGGQEEIDRVLAAKEVRVKQECELGWIVANWPTFKERGSYPGASMMYLMRRVGIAEPWGNHGEGYVYHANAMGTVEFLDPIMSTGDLDKVEAFLSEARVEGIDQ